MSVMQMILDRAANDARAAYDAAVSLGKSEFAAQEDAAGEYYFSLFKFFLDPNLSKWNVARHRRVGAHLNSQLSTLNSQLP